MPGIELHNQGFHVSPLVGGEPRSGGDGVDAGKPVPIPSVYFVKSVARAVGFGLGIDVSFGTATDYEDWMECYHAIKTDLFTVNSDPNIAWKINDNVAQGVGFDVLYFDLTLSSAIDHPPSA
jgi:long-chain fatty acid transport protein